jgi:hypothetical protein
MEYLAVSEKRFIGLLIKFRHDVNEKQGYFKIVDEISVRLDPGVH